MADHGLVILGEAHIEFESVAAVGQRLVEGGECIFRNRLEAAGAAVAEKQRTGLAGRSVG